PIRHYDENTGRILDANTYNIKYGSTPATWWCDPNHDGGNCATGSTWSADPSHAPSLAYVPYLVSGSQYLLDKVQNHANYMIWASNYQYHDVTWSWGGADNQSSGNQTRAIAWEARDIGYAAYITPDSDPLKTYFVNWAKSGYDHLVDWWVTQNHNGPYGEI